MATQHSSSPVKLVLVTLLAVTLASAGACSTSEPADPISDATALPPDGGDPGQEGGTAADLEPGLDAAPRPDDAGPPDTSPVAPDAPPPPDAAPLLPPDGALPPLPALENKVAAVQYGEGSAAAVKASCASHPLPDVCAMQELVLQARQAGARLVVTSEYGLGQQYYEPIPSIGENPGASAAWPDDALVKLFSRQAKALGIYLVIDLLTYAGQKPSYSYYNTQIAFDPTGAVVATHHKFNLFGGETTSLTAGADVTVFDTPLGKVGLLICADIYGSSTLLSKLAYTLKARLVAISSYWTVSNSVSWYKSYPSKYGVYGVVSNTTHSPGYGGGVYGPDGVPLAEKISAKPSVVVTTIPLP